MEIKGLHIIKSRQVVFMRMSENNRIKVFHFLPQHLVTKIRTSINH